MKKNLKITFMLALSCASLLAISQPKPFINLGLSVSSWLPNTNSYTTNTTLIEDRTKARVGGHIGFGVSDQIKKWLLIRTELSYHLSSLGVARYVDDSKLTSSNILRQSGEFTFQIYPLHIKKFWFGYGANLGIVIHYGSKNKPNLESYGFLDPTSSKHEGYLKDNFYNHQLILLYNLNKKFSINFNYRVSATPQAFKYRSTSFDNAKYWHEFLISTDFKF